MKFSSVLRPAVAPACLIFLIPPAHGQNKYVVTLPPTVTAATAVAVNFSVQNPPGTVVTAYNGSATITKSDTLATLSTATVPVNSGQGTFQVSFITSGSQTLTITDAAGAIAALTVTTTVVSTSNAALTACGSCYATIGAGVVISHQYSDYNNNSNVLETTHIGDSTPQYLLGVAYKLPIHDGLILPLPLYWPKVGDKRRLELAVSEYRKIGCEVSDFTTPSSDARAAYCYPWKAFINFKFTPDASQTFNGFTYGFSHALHKDLDLLFGVSYSAYNEPSPGFMAAAVNTLTTQLAAKNPCYSQSTLDSISHPPTKSEATVAFDGFPTQLLTNSGTATAPVCTPGIQIFSGSPLVTHYHSGFFIGIAIPLAFKSALQ